MRYDAVRVICFFDLPVDTNTEKRKYRYFRKSLLQNGFEMLQYSVYVRTCPNRSFANKYYEKLTRTAPNVGHIRLIMITEKQYEDMYLILGQRSVQEEVVGAKRLVII